MSRVYNFSAGPAALPTEVLEQAQAEMLDWNGSGMSVMEMSHRGKDYMSIAAKAEADLREVMNIPDNYKVLFLQGDEQCETTYSDRKGKYQSQTGITLPRILKKS